MSISPTDTKLMESRWGKRFALLEQFVEREGHARPVKGHTEQGVEIGKWVSYQRTEIRKGRLPMNATLKLRALPGWSDNPHHDSWESHYSALAVFSEREGHCRVPTQHLEEGLALGYWVQQQRNAIRGGLISEARKTRLEVLPGFNPGSRLHHRAAMISALMSFTDRECHSRVPRSHVESGMSLGWWADGQRKAYSAGTVSPEVEKTLNAVPYWRWQLQSPRKPRNVRATVQGNLTLDTGRQVTAA